jgi:hypothetical protein
MKINALAKCRRVLTHNMAQVLIKQQEARVRRQNADINILHYFVNPVDLMILYLLLVVRSLIKTHLMHHTSLFAIDN